MDQVTLSSSGGKKAEEKTGNSGAMEAASEDDGCFGTQLSGTSSRGDASIVEACDQGWRGANSLGQRCQRGDYGEGVGER